MHLLISKEEDTSVYYTDGYYKRGLVYLSLGEKQKAIEDFKQAVNRDSNYAEAYYNRGTAQVLIGENKKAIENYNQALQRNSNFTEAYYLPAWYCLLEPRRGSESSQQWRSAQMVKSSPVAVMIKPSNYGTCKLD